MYNGYFVGGKSIERQDCMFLAQHNRSGTMLPIL